MFNKFSITKNQRKEYVALAGSIILTLYIIGLLGAEFDKGEVVVSPGFLFGVGIGWWMFTVPLIRRYRRLHKENAKVKKFKGMPHGDKLIRLGSIDGVLGKLHKQAIS